MKRIAKTSIITLALFTLLAGRVFPQMLQTPAEKADYQQRGTLYAPMMEFIYDLASRSELLQVRKFSETLMGRDIVLAIMSDPPVSKPSDIANSDRPVVLIVNNVHGGEFAGKEATLALMRDLVLGELKPLLKKTVMLIIPTINPDGAEVYRRTNEQGFDLNRDYIKLESQEIQALLTEVINTWQPDIHVDTHHGGSAPYTLTYQTCLNPSCDPDIVALANDRIIPRIRASLRKEDYDGFWYSGPTRVGGVEGWGPTSVEPRKQHTYSGLANMVGFLYETPSGTHRVVKNGTEVVAVEQKDRFRHQVRGQYIGQLEVIRFAAEEAQLLRSTVDKAKRKAIELGSNDADNDPIILEYKQESKGDEAFWKLQAAAEGSERRYERVTQPIFTKFSATRTTVRPWGYLMPPNLANLIPLLLDHEITVQKLIEAVELEVETYYAAQVEQKGYFQGHYLKAVKAEKRTQKVKFPAGSFFIPAGQPKANLVSYILEPETDDNLVTWNFLDNYLQSMTAEQEERVAEMRARAGGQRSPGQVIPIFRLMKKAELKSVLAEAYNKYQRNRFVR